MEKEDLDWNLIKSILQEELKKTKSIMTFGTIGSCNIDHDIDLIITKKPSSPSSEFLREIHTLFENLDFCLNKEYKTRVIRFNQSIEGLYSQEMIKEKSVMFHVLIYVCLPQLVTHWKWSLPKDKDIMEILKRDYSCLYGKTNDLLSKEFNSDNYYSFMFTYIVMYDHVNFPLPKDFMLKISNYYFKYLYKKHLGLEAPVARNRKEVKKYFYELCDILDKLTRKRRD